MLPGSHTMMCPVPLDGVTSIHRWSRRHERIRHTVFGPKPARIEGGRGVPPRARSTGPTDPPDSAVRIREASATTWARRSGDGRLRDPSRQVEGMLGGSGSDASLP